METSSTYIALDYGTNKTGIAYSTMSFAFSLRTVPTRDLYTIIPELIRQKKASAIIIGMPYNIDGSMSKHGKRVQDFARKLE